MATFSHKLYHPQNKSPEDVYQGFSFGCFLFGPFWFLFKQLWIPAIIYFVACFFGIGFFAWLIVPFFANEIHRKSLLKQGYLTQEQLGGPQTGMPMMHHASTFVPPMAATPISAAATPVTTIQAPNNTQPTTSLLRDSLVVEWKREGITDMSGNYRFLSYPEKELLFTCQDAKAASKGFIKQGLGLNAMASFDVMFMNLMGQPMFRLIGSGGAISNRVDIIADGRALARAEKKGMVTPSYIAQSGLGHFEAKSIGLGNIVERFDLLKNGAKIGTAHRGEDKKLGAYNFLLEFTPGMLSENEKIILLGCFYGLRQYMCGSV